MEKIEPSSPKISLSNPSVVTDKLKTTVNYIIKTESKSDRYESIRNYEEFIQLRKVLTQKWPGIFIPPIPSKPFLSSLNTKYVKTYKRQLEDFFSYTQSVSFLYESEEFQCFLRSKSPFTTKLSISLSETALNYQAIFHEYTGIALSSSLISSLNEDKAYLQDSLGLIIDMRDKSEVLSEDFKKFHNLLAASCNSLQKNEDLLLGSQSNPLFVAPDLMCIKNNFSELFNWAENEILQIEAMLESIEFIEKLQKMQDGIENGVEVWKKELEKIEKNKVSFFQIVSFKSNERFTRDKNLQIAQKENEIMNLKNFQAIIALRLKEIDLPLFKKTRFSSFSALREKYNELVEQSLDSFRAAANRSLHNVAKIKMNNF